MDMDVKAAIDQLRFSLIDLVIHTDKRVPDAAAETVDRWLSSDKPLSATWPLYVHAIVTLIRHARTSVDVSDLSPEQRAVVVECAGTLRAG